MSAVLADAAPAPPPATVPPATTGSRRWWSAPRWRRLSALQLAVLALASIAPIVIGIGVVLGTLGVITEAQMIELALAAGENPGMITFGAMFLASPVQWLTGRSQVRVRKYLGIVFFLLALSNLAMFVLESGAGLVLSAPLLVAGTVAVALAAPLFATSSRWAQRAMGLRRWKLLHKATYLVAVALVAHVVLIGDVGLGFVLITLGALARIPVIRRRLEAGGIRRMPTRRPEVAPAP